MIDSFGREIRYLRLSVTDRCNFRCRYCMAEDASFLPPDRVLDIDETVRLARILIGLGVDKLRLTGGEPLVRCGVGDLIRRLGVEVTAGRLREFTLTTNGTRLAGYAPVLYAAGMRRVNVSLDTLDPATFREITRSDDLERVLDGIAAARRAGLAVKINTVVQPGVNETHLDTLIAWCGARGHDLTLIELMPLGPLARETPFQYLPLDAVRRDLAARWTLMPCEGPVQGGPASYVRVAETGRRLGFIAPLEHNFCGSCDRVRLTCDGTLVPCLGRESGIDLRGVLRASRDDDAVRQAIMAAIATKPKGHGFAVGTPDRDRFADRGNRMHRVGG
jgi:GTP 3',8-cyclase